MLFKDDGTFSSKFFPTTSGWTQAVIPFSELASDGRDVSEILFASSTPGAFHFELSDAHLGARRWLGLEIELRPTRGAQLGAIDKDSPAGKAGLKVGDTITAFDGKPVGSYRGLLQLLSGTHIHDKVPIEVVRDGKHQTVTVEVEERPN
jgi:S1-C subfamily serine protease